MKVKGDQVVTWWIMAFWRGALPILLAGVCSCVSRMRACNGANMYKQENTKYNSLPM